jgi:hypothetical protein
MNQDTKRCAVNGVAEVAFKTKAEAFTVELYTDEVVDGRNCTNQYYFISPSKLGSRG